MNKNRINDLIDELAKKSGISELIINKNDNVYVEKDGEMIRIDAKFTDEEMDLFCHDIAIHNRKDFDSKFSQALRLYLEFPLGKLEERQHQENNTYRVQLLLTELPHMI